MDGIQQRAGQSFAGRVGILRICSTQFTSIRDGYRNWQRLREAYDKHESRKSHAFAQTKLKSYSDSHAPDSHLWNETGSMLKLFLILPCYVPS